MANASFARVLNHVRELVAAHQTGTASDRDLLERFRNHREEAAFTLLAQRHGPMVLNTCRRILGDVQEAEDAFQATFLILARRAGSVRWQASVGGWLHTVAQRLAVRARKQAEQRRIHERG